jgi:hypothetical protein
VTGLEEVGSPEGNGGPENSDEPEFCPDVLGAAASSVMTIEDPVAPPPPNAMSC